MKIEIGKDFPRYFKPSYPEEFELFSHFEVSAGIPTVLFAITTWKENGKPMPLRPEECLAVISDVDVEDCENVFPLDDVGKTAAFLLQYIQQNMQHIENL